MPDATLNGSPDNPVTRGGSRSGAAANYQAGPNPRMPDGDVPRTGGGAPPTRDRHPIRWRT